MFGAVSRFFRMMDQRDAPIMASDECTQPKVRLQLINEKARRHTPRPSLSGTNSPDTLPIRH